MTIEEILTVIQQLKDTYGEDAVNAALQSGETDNEHM